MHEDKRESYAHTRGMHTVQNTNMWCIGNSGCRRRRRQFSFLIIMLKLIFFLLTPLYVHWEAVSFVSSTSYSQQYQKQLIMMIYSWCALILCYIDAKSSCTGNSWFYFNRKELQLFRILRVVASKWWSSRPPSGCNHSEWPHQKKIFTTRDALCSADWRQTLFWSVRLPTYVHWLMAAHLPL